MSNYILDEAGEPVIEPDVIRWAKWFEHAPDRILRQDQVGEAMVSTVFLGVDHNFNGDGPPILFETMIFGGQQDGDQQRYCTRAEALKGHYATVIEVRQLASAHAPTKRHICVPKPITNDQ